MLLNDKVPFRMQWPQYADLQINGMLLIHPFMKAWFLIKKNCPYMYHMIITSFETIFIYHICKLVTKSV